MNLSPDPSLKSSEVVLGLASFCFYKPDIIKSKLKHFPSKENVIKYLSFSRENKISICSQLLILQVFPMDSLLSGML